MFSCCFSPRKPEEAAKLLHEEANKETSLPATKKLSKKNQKKAVAALRTPSKATSRTQYKKPLHISSERELSSLEKDSWVDESESTLFLTDNDSIIEVANRQVTLNNLAPFLKLYFPVQCNFFEQYFSAEEEFSTYGGETETGMVLVNYRQNSKAENGPETVMVVRDGYANYFFSMPGLLPLEQLIREVHLTLDLSSLSPLPHDAVAFQRINDLDEKLIITTYKFGVLYCGEDQTEESEWFNNEHGSPAFNRFISLLGDKVEMKGWDHYKAGLDTKEDLTGQYSVYTTFEEMEIMFHVSTLLEHSNEEQQIAKKRYIGNDIVLIIFKEGSQKLLPKCRSQFNHIFIVVEEDKEKEGHYVVGVARKKDVENFGPPLPSPPSIPASMLREFLLYKALNGEWACYVSKQFQTRLSSARQGQIELFIETEYKRQPPNNE